MHCTTCGKKLSMTDTGDNYIRCPYCDNLNRIPDIKSIKGGADLETGESGENNARVFPTIWQALFLVLGLFAAMIVVFIPIGIIAAVTGLDLTDNLFLQSLAQILAFAIIIFIGVKKSKLPLNELFPLREFNYISIIPIFITIAGTTILLSDVDNLFRMLFPAPEFIMEIFQQLYENPLKAVILAIIIAPVTEEVLCRGLILNGFLKNYSVNKAVIASSLLFAFMHFNPWQFVGAFFFGILLAWFYIGTKSLWSCLIGHAIANLMPLLVIDIFGLEIRGFSEAVPGEAEFQPWWFDLIGLALFFIGFIWLRNLFKGKNDIQ